MVKKIILVVSLLAASCSAQTFVHELAKALACADSSGSGTTQVCNTSPTYSPVAGDWIVYSTTTTNTGDVTVNVNSLGAKHVRKWLAASVLASGDLPSGVSVPLYYDGTYWEAMSIGNAPSGGGSGSPVYDLVTGVGSYLIPTTDFSAPAPMCGFIRVHGAIGLTVPVSTSQPPAGQCIKVFEDFPATATLNTNGQNIQNNSSIQYNTTVTLISDGTNFVAYTDMGINDNGDNDLFYGYSISGQYAGYNTMFCSDCGNGSMGIENTIVGRSVGKNITGQQNTYVGFNNGNGNSSGSANVGVGISVGAGTSGSNNVTVGSNAGGTTGSGSNNTLLGYGTDVPSGSTSNYVNVADLIYGDKSKGILALKGATASLASCGTSPTLASGSNDMTGEVTPGSGSPTSCTVSFANTHNQAPFCTITPIGNLFEYISTKSTSGFTVTAAAGLVEFDYHCIAGSTSATPTL